MPKQTQNNRGLKNKVYYPERDHILAEKILKTLTKYPFSSTKQIAEKTTAKKYSYSQQRIVNTLSRLKELDYCKEFALISNSNYVCKYCKNSTRYLVEYESLQEDLRIIKENQKIRELSKKKKNYNPKDYFDCPKDHVVGRLAGMICFSCEKFVHFTTDDPFKIRKYRYWNLSENGKFIMLGILNGVLLLDFIKKNNENIIFKLLDILLRSQKKNFVNRLLKRLNYDMKIDPNVSKIVNKWYEEIIPTILNLECNEKLPLYDYKKDLQLYHISTTAFNARRHR